MLLCRLMGPARRNATPRSCRSDSRASTSKHSCGQEHRLPPAAAARCFCCGAGARAARTRPQKCAHCSAHSVVTRERHSGAGRLPPRICGAHLRGLGCPSGRPRHLPGGGPPRHCPWGSDAAQRHRVMASSCADAGTAHASCVRASLRDGSMSRSGCRRVVAVAMGARATGRCLVHKTGPGQDTQCHTVEETVATPPALATQGTPHHRRRVLPGGQPGPRGVRANSAACLQTGVSSCYTRAQQKPVSIALWPEFSPALRRKSPVYSRGSKFAGLLERDAPSRGRAFPPKLSKATGPASPGPSCGWLRALWFANVPALDNAYIRRDASASRMGPPTYQWTRRGLRSPMLPDGEPCHSGAL